MTVLSGIKEYVLMALGMFMYAFGWIGCVMPAGGMGGGAAGLAMLLSHLIPFLSIGELVFLITGILLIFGGFIVGWNFGIKTIYCIVMLSLSMDVVENMIPEDMMLVLTSSIDSQDMLLVLLGAILCGCGIALGFLQGGSTGGTDIVAMIINKYHRVSYGRILISSDLFIIGSSLFFATDFASGVAMVIYGYIMVTVVGYTVDLIMAGNQQSSQVFIICKDYRKMADMIVNRMHRGATVLDATGWYSQHETKIVMVVCRKRDASALLKLAKEVDSEAFITVGSVMGVYGKGFDALNKV